MSKKLCKSKRRMLFGVCGGVAEYFNWDVTIVRIAVIVLTFLTKLVMPVIYLFCAVIFPDRHIDDDNWQYDDEDLKSANIDGERIHKNGETGGKADYDEDEAENARRFAENADKLRTDSEFDSYFKK